MKNKPNPRVANIGRAREIAFDVLLLVETGGAYSNDLLHAKLEGAVSAANAALATELTLGTLRWQRLLDFLLEGALPRRSQRLDAEVRIALRLGLYQLRFLGGIPARAAVNESVDLVKRARKKSAASLVNAVLRRLAGKDEKKVVETFLTDELSEAERLGILHSHPTWLIERWNSAFGMERTEALLAANNRAAEIACAVLDAAKHAETVNDLRKSGLNVRPGNLLRQALLIGGGAPARSTAYAKGDISLLDEGSQAVANLLGVESGHSVLDLCAAPGGKTTLLAQAAGPGGRVLACDLHVSRLRSVDAQMKRIHAQNVETRALDATEPLPFDGEFDRVLVDAPCSGTGTLARHPEIRWRLRLEDLSDLRARQVALLRSGLDRVKPGGRLVYSTCSLEAEENETVVREALRARGEFRIVNAGTGIEGFLAESMKADRVVDADGFFRTFPPETRTDGFFAALIERSS
jgi:16S rRNA (cytosine967-C5)-methyltransferase